MRCLLLERVKNTPWWGGLMVVLAVSATVVSVGSAGAGASPRASAEPAPVPSLEPLATERLWRRLVQTREGRAQQAPADCRPLRAVFYAATDYLRLAAKLAEQASPCAEYYVSIPPLVADKTKPRPNAASRVRALGGNFHALAEVHFATWTRWVASTGSSWHAAGVAFRERMAAAGYDVTNGDSWALNEASSAVRRGTGNARANLREFLRGLYEGDGTRPTKGAILVIGVGQRSSDVSLYQTNLQNWFTDAAFWTDMATYVSDWSQEVYGDYRSFAAPGVPAPARRDYLNDYLQHQILLAGVGPPTIETARAFLQTTFSPLANAAWERQSGYGWTMVPAEQMAGYVSAQVHALRYFGATSGQPQDHWGFAWAPRNGTGMSAGDFASQTDLILERLAAAIRDSAATVDPADPGSAACGPPGQNLWCVGDLAEARATEAWKSFRTWTQSVLAFASQAPTLAAATPSGPLSLRLVTSSGLSVTTPVPITVTLGSSSPQGVFAASSAGPWTPTLQLTIPAETGTSPIFFYQDTRAGTPEITAAGGGVTSGAQIVTITPGPVTALTIAPRAATLRARSSLQFTATGTDAHGNRVLVPATWSVTPGALGTIAPRAAITTTLSAGRTLGRGVVTASVPSEIGVISATSRVTVLRGRLRIASIKYRIVKNTVLVTATAVDVAGRPVSRAIVSVLVRRDGNRHYGTRGSTGASGRKVYRVPARRPGCYVTTITRVSAAGFTWNGRTPRNRFCRPRSD